MYMDTTDKYKYTQFSAISDTNMWVAISADFDVTSYLNHVINCFSSLRDNMSSCPGLEVGRYIWDGMRCSHFFSEIHHTGILQGRYRSLHVKNN